MPILSKTAKPFIGVLAALSFATLTACGGGGGGGSTGSGGTGGGTGGGGAGGGGGTSLTTVSGTASKGLLSNAVVSVFTGTDGDTPVATGRTDANGNYSISFTPPAGAEILAVAVTLDGATMVCDSTVECGPGVNFGDTFVVEAPDSFLVAPFLPPAAGASETVNVNTLTNLHFIKMIGLEITRRGGFSEDADYDLQASDLLPARSFIANAFGFTDQDFTKLPFVDTTTTISSGNGDAIKAALLASGYLQAAIEEGLALGTLDFESLYGLAQGSFITPAGPVASEGFAAAPGNITLREIFAAARDVADANTAVSNAFTIAVDELAERETVLNILVPGARLDAEGNIIAPFTDIEFVAESINVDTGATGQVLNIVNPNALSYTAQVTGTGSQFFAVEESSPVNALLTINSAPVGTYNLTVTFDTEFGEPFSDTIEVTISEPEIGVVEDSVTVSLQAVGDGFWNLDLTPVNPDNYQFSCASFSGTGSEAFEVSASSDQILLNLVRDFTVQGDPFVAQPGTYDLTLDIQTTTVGVSGSDALQIIVTE